MFNTAVARPVARKEMMENEEARKAMRKEWLGQHAAGVYDFSVVREYDDVVREAKRNGTEVHMARIHGICVEKNYQLPKGNPSRKFKGRGVLLGNQVKNQFWEAAFFQDLGNSPATFEASRWADFYGCLPGHGVKLADAIQAYNQAVLTGPPCWVELPEDAWPDDIDFRKFRRPVVRLVKALWSSWFRYNVGTALWSESTGVRFCTRWWRMAVNVFSQEASIITGYLCWWPEIGWSGREPD